MLANRQDQDGRLPEIEDVAFSLRMTEKEAQTMISALVSGKLIDKRGSVLCMHDWQSWQPIEKTSAQRSKEYREEQKKRALSERSDERSHENEGERSGESDSSAPSIVCNGIGRAKEEDPPTPQRGNGAIESLAVPMNPEAEVKRIASLAEKRWPMQEAGRQIEDMCETWDYRLVSKITDQAFVKDKKKFLHGWIRSGCQNQTRDGWKPEKAPPASPHSESAAYDPAKGRKAMEAAMAALEQSRLEGLARKGKTP